MAVITMGCNMQYETPNKRVYLCECIVKSSLNAPPRWHTCYLPINSSTSATKMKQKEPADDGESSYKGHLRLPMLKLASDWTVWLASESGTDRRQLRSLTSYFGRIQGDRNYQSLDPSKTERELVDTGESTSNTGLKSLDAYFKKLNEDSVNDQPFTMDKQADSVNDQTFTMDKQGSKGDLVSSPNLSQFSRRDKNAREKNIGERNPGTSQQQDEEASNLYLISILASINIAVFLFEIASPIRTSDPELLSLPLLYGGKVNDLIIVGEWWRLLTPMFLHSGFFHISLGCWALLTFGRRVCQGYGPFTFFLIYVLGGVSGNLTSFFHTPELTVGGTGPVFALIGAWLMHQLQNKDVIAKDVTDNMFQKAIIATAISFVLSNAGPIDDWAHFGAALTGIIYGFLTSPSEASLRSSQEEGMTLVRRYADPCKSLVWFTIFILAFTSLLLFLDPPLNTLSSSTYF